MSPFPRHVCHVRAWLAVRPLVALAGVALSVASCGCRFFGGDSRLSQSMHASRDLSNQGLRAMENRDVQAAESLLSRAVKACPADPEARRHHAEALWQSGKNQDALREIAEAVRLDPGDAAIHVRASAMQLDLGNTVEAGREAEIAIDLDPRSAQAWRSRGRVYASIGENRRALADFQRALAFAPQDRELLQDLAEMYKTSGQPRRMLAVVQRLEETYAPGEEPQHVLHLTGLAYEAQGRYQRAADCFAKALERGPATPELLQAQAANEHRLQTASVSDEDATRQTSKPARGMAKR